MHDNRRRSLIYETVLEHVKGELLAGGLRPGDQLPTVAAQARTMGVSAAAVREAYRVLGTMGLLDVTQGRGTFVAALPANGPSILGRFQLADNQSLAHLFEARLLLEPPIAAWPRGGHPRLSAKRSWRRHASRSGSTARAWTSSNRTSDFTSSS